MERENTLVTEAQNGQSPELQWLDKKYVRVIMSNYEKVSIRSIISFTKEQATVKGENFASAMHLLKVEYTTNDDDKVKKVSLIVKSRLNNEFMSAIEEEFDVFSREAQVYKLIMTEAERLLQFIGDDTKFGPKPVFVDDRVIVQENLKDKGYCIDDVKKGLSYQQCRMILSKLAKFHACSMVLYRKTPEIFKHHMPGNLSEAWSPLHDLYKNSIQTCIEYCETDSELHLYVSKLRNFAQKIIQTLINVFCRNQNDRYHVLNHGDAWCNNFMFRTNRNGSPDDVLFVDYQEGYFGSPGIDWNYFMYSSWRRDVYVDHKEHLIEEYHKVLSQVLQQLNYDKRIPTVDDVKKEIKNKGYHGLTTATCLLPILINEHSHLADPMNFLADTEEAKRNRFTVFNNANFGESLKLFLKDFVAEGIL